MNPRNFFAELKRRNVYKVAVAYAVIAWLLIQAASILFPTFEAPGWVMKVFVTVIAAGFPIALVIAWAFEMTPEGMKRTESVSPNEFIPQWSRRKFATLIVGVALLATGLLIVQLWRSQSSPSKARMPQRSIAVLPFVNMSSDQENAYFADGLTEEILSRLAQIKALKVPGRTSSFVFKNQNRDLREVGAALGVAHVLEGSVRKSGDRLRITAQLERTSDGYHLWSQAYDRKLDDVFTIQEEIARAIADALSVQLNLGGNDKSGKPTQDMQAYDSYLEARTLITRRSTENLRRAIMLLESAVQRDPAFANAWAALAQARALAPYYFLTPMKESFEGAETAARKALSLDDATALAHSALADVLRDRFDWLAAETEFQRALELDPNEAETHNQYGQMLFKVGHLDAAFEHIGRAQELEPLAWVPCSMAALQHLYRGELSKTREWLDRSRRMVDPPAAYQIQLELIYALSSHDTDGARRALAMARSSSSVWSLPPTQRLVEAMDAALAYFATRSGSPPDLDKVIKENELGTGYMLSFAAVAIYTGQKEVALNALSANFRSPFVIDTALMWTPIFHALRSEPRFLELVRTAKLPEYWRVAGWGDFCRPKGGEDFDCIAP